jgi:AraC-like DNA-binding protein
MFWHIGGEETVRRNVTDDPYRCLVMEFRMKTPVPPRRFPRITVLREPRIAARLTEEWLGIDLRDPLDMRTFCQYAYGRLCWEAHSALTRRPGVPANLSVSRPAALQRILEHIRLHFAEDLMLADLARIGGISESGVHLLFRKHLQQSPHRHLLCVRIQEARRLLANSDLTIKEIAGACGFMSTENFCRNFRRENGVSAGEYRQKTRTEMLEL